MAFFDWLRRLIEPAPRRGPKHALRRQALPTTAKVTPVVSKPSQATPTATPPATPVPTPAIKPSAPEPTATLVVRLVDENDHPLQPALILTGQLNHAIRFSFPIIPGYVLTHTHGFTQDFITEYGLTTLTYQRQWGRPIVTYLIDYDNGQLLKLPTMHRGRLDERYQLTPPEVSGYRIFQAQGAQRGQFSQQTHRVIYFYRRDAWQTVQRVHQYVLLTADHQIVNQPAGQAYGYQFPANSLWRLFVVVTRTDGSVWYNLGGEQWLAATETTLRDHPLPTGLPQRHHWNVQPFARLGSVDYVPHAAVTIFKEPYGESIGQLDHGEPLDVRGRVVDDQNLVWYQIGPDAYISAHYVRLVPVASA
ncbi:MucBP domain-containing protein [Levilactobacillus enshiensis]|uniref:MucBP domain-containing protein n=1 Tax=Levilactobacillus enshiensis TaxID=2590213 RepID=UPI00117BB3D1|nr:MucBP domain-containing protein [Levilactobacillus enshiensis]